VPGTSQSAAESTAVVPAAEEGEDADEEENKGLFADICMIMLVI